MAKQQHKTGPHQGCLWHLLIHRVEWQSVIGGLPCGECPPGSSISNGPRALRVTLKKDLCGGAG